MSPAGCDLLEGQGIRDWNAPDAMDLRLAVALSLLDGQALVQARRWLPCSSFEPQPVVVTDSVYEAADRAMVRAAARQLIGIPWGASDYPAALTTIIDPPPILWIRGHADGFRRPSVAIVGSRAASHYGLEVATSLGRDLARRGVTIVSGMARGIDSAAHRGALEGDGLTLAVLGCGADVAYPPEHQALAKKIAETGAVLSELAAGMPPLRRHFPSRNRLISGLASVVVVIEASERSGSLITARCALEQGREVMVVPGSVLNGRNRGSHALLKDGAGLVETVEDVLDELNGTWTARVADGAKVAHGEVSDPLLIAIEPGDALTIDEIVAQVGTSSSEVLARLLELEVKGLLRRVSGGRFVRSESSVLP